MLTIGNIRRSCRCLIISMVFKHGVCSVNRILLISYIILFIYSFHYITFRFTIFWSFHNSFLVTCPSSFLFHILFDFYVPSTYCTTTFYLDLCPKRIISRFIVLIHYFPCILTLYSPVWSFFKWTPTTSVIVCNTFTSNLINMILWLSYILISYFFYHSLIIWYIS